jgi:lipoprotein NlpI
MSVRPLRRVTGVVVWAMAMLLVPTVTTVAYTQTPRGLLDQAVADFSEGRFEEAAAGFDQVAREAPDLAPQLWQRGIALYYAGRYGDCRRQFELHLTVNPSDVENSAWHFLCVARAESPEAALEALLPVGPDPRRPMREIYEMFSGRMAPQAVLSAAGGQPRARFYAHLYRGLYHEALGRTEAAREEIVLAADAQFAQIGGYMHMVAVVHRNQLGR